LSKCLVVNAAFGKLQLLLLFNLLTLQSFFL
jgi:hypothetical protein